MKVGFNSLHQWDTLTEKELPLLDSDEQVRIRKRRDLLKDTAAERKSSRYRSEEEGIKLAEKSGPDAVPPEPGYYSDPFFLLVEQFEYMTDGQPDDQDPWHIFDQNEDGTRGKAIPFTKANRETFCKIHGLWLMAQMAIRGGGIAPKLEGKVDPATGKPLTFPGHDTDAAGQDGLVPSPVSSVRTAGKVSDR